MNAKAKPRGLRITSKNVTETDTPDRWSTEASSLGLRPGEWPTVLETDLGNGQQFVIAEQKVEDGEVLYVRYQQSYSKTQLVVFND